MVIFARNKRFSEGVLNTLSPILSNFLKQKTFSYYCVDNYFT
jgi:hypothetical protein